MGIGRIFPPRPFFALSPRESLFTGYCCICRYRVEFLDGNNLLQIIIILQHPLNVVKSFALLICNIPHSLGQVQNAIKLQTMTRFLFGAFYKNLLEGTLSLRNANILKQAKNIKEADGIYTTLSLKRVPCDTRYHYIPNILIFPSL